MEEEQQQRQQQNPTSRNANDKKLVVQESVNKLKEKVSPGVRFSLLIAEAIHLSMLVVGSIHVHNCPVNKYIPIFLIVVGAIGLVSKFVSYIRKKISTYTEVGYIESAFYTAELIFFLLGNYWVYSEFQPSYDPNDGPKYCNKTAYLFAFIYITFFYAFFIVLLLGFCCFVCCAFCLTVASTRSGDSESGSANREARKALTSTTIENVDETKE